MSTNPSSSIATERVDDIPILLRHLKQMDVPLLLDRIFPTHGNWTGLSLGWTTTIWLVYILSQADHRLSHVQDWVAQHIETLKKCTGLLSISDLNFSDDRLSAILRRFNEDETWEIYEQNQAQHNIRVYDLPSSRVRLDTTTASTYQAPSINGLFQLGHSKDHRPDLAQVKVMLSSLDPLGLPLASQQVEGSKADDRGKCFFAKNICLDPII
jgi:transposase